MFSSCPGPSREHSNAKPAALRPPPLADPATWLVALRTMSYNNSMEKVVRIFHSHAEADEADALWDAQLTPEERIRITLELRNLRHPDAAQQGLARVYRVVELERS
jgi:hypothetical protein